MAFEKRYSLLTKRAAGDYRDILEQTNFSPKNAEMQAERIVVAKALLNYMVDLCQYLGQKKLKDYATFLNSSSSFCCGVI